MSILILVQCAMLGSCATTADVSRARSPVDDIALFRAAVAAIVVESGLSVRVDPRPLKADPGLVSLHDIQEMPERIAADVLHDPLEAVDSGLIRARAVVLREVSIRQTDALRDARCPGALMPTTPEVDEERRLHCPDPGFYSVIIGLPREGGPYWPMNFDERAVYANQKVFSVRVIARHVSRQGSAEESSDYVFERDSVGTWRFIKRRPLLVVE